MIIYKVKNTKNGKIYIGKSEKTLDNRKKRHYKSVRKGSKTHFHNSLRKYEENIFEWKIIEETKDAERESYWIEYYDSFKNGYNMTLGGDGGDTISMKSSKEKRKQGAKKGNIPWNKEVKYTEQQKNKWGYYSRLPRRTFTEKQKREHSIIIKNSKKYQDGLKKRKHGRATSIIEIKNNKIIKRWEYIKDLAKEIGLDWRTVKKYILSNELINNRTFIYEGK
jgi:group I intron endonuclease